MSFFLFAMGVFALTPQQIFADGGCMQLNNGGLTKQQFCPTPTVLPSPAPFKEDLPQQTKGGQKIFPSNNSKSTPNTGPEEWSLPALFLIGGLGFFLRNKALKHN